MRRRDTRSANRIGRRLGALVAAFLIALPVALWKQCRQAAAPQEPSPTASPSPSPTPSLELPKGAEKARIKRALDGDSVVLEDGRELRYIGVDAPEKDEPFHDEAKRFNAEQVDGREVWLEADAESTDTHERRLAYVYLKVDDRVTMVNADLLRRGLARVYLPGDNEKHKALLIDCQKEARAEHRGVWAKEPAAKETLIGTKKGHAFHRTDCREMKSVPARGRITFASRDEALDAGRSACRVCKP